MTQPGFRRRHQSRWILQTSLPRERSGDGAGLLQKQTGREQRFVASLSGVDQLRDGKQFDRVALRERERAIGGSQIDADGCR